MKAHEKQTVKLLEAPEHDFDARGLHYHITVDGAHAREVFVDPAPCYPHSEVAATAELERLRQCAPLPFPLTVFLLSLETMSRSNGVYFDGYDYTAEQIEIGGKKLSPPVGAIVLSGKRIPIHPAMTRYLVPHEYGHGVMYHLARLRGITDDQLMATYREQCRPEASTKYGCGEWHHNVMELFANDFRILVADREPEFWPHPGLKRPDENLAVVGFWAKAVKELAA